MNNAELVSRLSAKIAGLEQKMQMIEQTYPVVLQVVQRLAEEREGHQLATARIEAYCFGLVTVLLRNGTVTYEQLSGAIDELPGAEDLLVLWGVHTEEESRAMRAAAAAAAAEPDDGVEGKNEEAADTASPSGPTPDSF